MNQYPVPIGELIYQYTNFKRDLISNTVLVIKVIYLI
jgi:hypothetical protein